MEYFVGSAITIVTILIFAKLLGKRLIETTSFNIMYSQSYLHSLLSPIIPTNSELLYMKNKKTQSYKHMKKTMTRVLFVKDRAYWVQSNAFYTADLVEGEVDKETTQVVDIMGMDKVQLEEMSFIVQMLTEGVSSEDGDSR